MSLEACLSWPGWVRWPVRYAQVKFQPPGCPPWCVHELPRGSSIVLSGLVRQTQAIGITRIENALAFLLRGAAFFLLDAASRCAGTLVLEAWMAWTPLSSAPRRPLLPFPMMLQGYPGCQSVQFSLWFHKPCSLRCLFGDAQRRALAIHVYCERLLESCSWEHSGMPARVHLGMLLGAISGLKMRSSRKAFTGSVTRRFPSLPNFW